MTLTRRLFLISFIAALSLQTMAPPVVALANNGDFGKVLAVFGLAASASDEYQFAPTRYSFHPSHYVVFGFYSSETILAAAAITLNVLVSKDGVFDIRLIGLVHGFLYVFAAWLLLTVTRNWTRVSQVFFCIALLIVFTDAMYASMLNSFYMDEAALLFLALALICAARAIKFGSAKDRIASLVFAALMVGAKTQHAPLGILFCAMYLLVAWRTPQVWSRSFALIATGILLACSVGSYVLTPITYRAAGLFSVIFTQVLPNSKNVDRDLRELDLDESNKSRIGAHAFSPGIQMDTPEQVRAFLERTSYSRLAWFFIRHPSRAWFAIHTSLDEGGRQRPLLGNFDRSVGLLPWTESRAFSFWSGWKKALFYHHGRIYFLFFVFIATANAVSLTFSRRKSSWAVLVMHGTIIAMAIVELLVAALTDAVEIGRHFFIFNTLVDVLIITGLLGIVARWQQPLPLVAAL
jgi:hypothetical protein